MRKRALAALCGLALIFVASPARAQIPGLPCIPGLPIPGLCPPTPTATPENTPTPASSATPLATTTPGGSTTPGTTSTPGTTFTPGTTPTLSGTGTPTPAPTADPLATPAPGGSVSIVAQSDVHGIDGESVDAGQFTIRNDTGTLETISEIRVQASDGAMFSSMTLTAGGQSVTISDPSTENSFFFDPDVEIPAGGSIEVSLSVTIGEASSESNATATPETSVTPSGTTTPTVTSTPGASFAGVTGRGPKSPSAPSGGGAGSSSGAETRLAIVSLLTAALAYGAWRSRSKRFGVALLLLGLTLYAACGSEQTSAQTVTGITASNGSGPVTMSGLPASLGTVSRPEPLVFPGAAAK